MMKKSKIKEGISKRINIFGFRIPERHTFRTQNDSDKKQNQSSKL